MGRYSVPLAPRFADLASLAAGQRVVDVGCGPGALTTELVVRVGAAGGRSGKGASCEQRATEAPV